MIERLKQDIVEIAKPKDVDVLLLCGGKGTRLKVSNNSQLQSLPKPLVQINTARGNIRMIDNAILNLTACGFTQLTFLTGKDPDTQGHEIENYVVSTYGRLNPLFSQEDTPLGTAGATHEAFLFSRKNNAIVTPVDTLFPFYSLHNAFQKFIKDNAGIMWIVTSNPGINAQNTGRVIVDNKYVLRDDEGKIEKTKVFETEKAMTSSGVIIASRTYFLERYRDFNKEKVSQKTSDLYRDFIPWLLQRGEKISYFDVRVPTPDLGTPDRLKQFGKTKIIP